MSDLKPYGILFILATVFFQANGQRNGKFTSQPDSIHKNAMVIYVSGGAGYFASSQGAPAYLQPTVYKVNPEATIRILWHPRYLLRGGLETGLVNFYRYALKDSANNSGKIRLSAIPLILVWSMAVTRHFNIFAGSGGYLMTTTLQYQGKSIAHKFNVGWMAAASYIVPLSANAGLGAEAKWLYASGTSNGVFCLQVQYVWKFLKW